MSETRVAVVGSGIAGLAAAWLLSQRYQVSLFEADNRLGGHTNTVDIVGDQGQPLAVDTGFIVFNDRNYPNLRALFSHLGVATHDSSMSFSFSSRSTGLEWAGDSLNTVFGQRRNLIRPSFLRMALDILRFNAQARRLLSQPPDDAQSLAGFLDSAGIGPAMRRSYLLPMAAAIWSCPQRDMLAFPARRFLQFYQNHGLLDLINRPQWHTVSGGARTYIEVMRPGISGPIALATPVRSIRRSADAVTLHGDQGELGVFDQVVVATHADQALALLAAPDAAESRLLGAFGYQRNVAWLHTDTALMPRLRRVWAAWNYLGNRDDAPPAVTYWMNRLQGLPGPSQYLVTLNPEQPPKDAQVLRRIIYDHPVFDQAACAAQTELAGIQGRQRTWYCGSYCGYGFHEDALSSAIAVAKALSVTPPWSETRAEAG